MTHVRRFVGRMLALLRPGKAESDLSREISAHLQLLEDTYVARGMARADARYAARRAFGGVEQVKEEQRDARSFRWLAGWPMDLKLGARMLIKTPGLTVVAVIALAIAIGAGAAYFEFFNDFFRPSLAFKGGDRLVGILTWDVSKNAVEGRTAYEFTEWRDELRTIEELGAGRAIDQNLTTDDGRTEPVRGMEISASAFRLIPVAPLFGRPLNADDEWPGAPHVLVLGQDVWRARFQSDPAVVGRTVTLGDTPHTIVGVMPEGFAFPVNHTLWTPLGLERAALTRGEGPAIRVFGRLAAGADLDAAQAELVAVGAAAPDAAAYQHLRPQVKPYIQSLWSKPNMSWQVRVLYSFNLFFVGLLGICGANVATLVFARTATREGEITVRTALGASRGRIVSQLVVEALVLAALAAVVGLGGASMALRYAREIWVAAQGQPMPFWWNESLGIETFLYVAVLVVLAALLVGGVPALKATGAVMQARLKQAGAGGSTGGSTMRFGKFWTGIIVTQVALTLVFLLSTVSLGWEAAAANRRFNEVTFQRAEYLTARIRMEPDELPDRRKAALLELERRLAEEPSVRNITFTNRLPGRGQEEFWVELPSKAMQDEAFARAEDDVLWVRSTRIGPNYFETFKVPLVAGRLFTPSEIDSDRPVAIVDETFVQQVLGGRAAVGQMVRQPPKDAGEVPGPWFEIVGVVKDVSTTPNKKTEYAMLYRPLAPGGSERLLRVVLHGRGDAAALSTPLRRAAAAADPGLRLQEVLTLDRIADEDAMTMGFFVRSLGVIGAVALLLSTAGIYALISFTLGRRTREIGIRIALGAAPRQIVTGVLSKALVQIGLGLAIGAIPGVAIMRLGLEDDTGGTGLAAGIAITLGVAVFVLSIAAATCTVPLRRALRIQPTQALRADA